MIAYCFMPDHLHLLVEGLDPSSSLHAFVHRWKQASAFSWKQRTGRPLWQRGYYEHTLRADEDTFKVARYLIANPLRARLVEQIQDYPLIGSGIMATKDLFQSVQIEFGGHWRD